MKNLMLKMAMTLADGNDQIEGAISDAYNGFKTVMMYILPIVLAVVLMLGIFFGIKLGIAFAKAEDADARDKAKGQLINMLIGIGVAAVIITICIILVNSNVFAGLFNFDNSKL